MTDNELIQAWRDLINGPGKLWVLFENGTCVILVEPAADFAAQAIVLLKEFGPVYPGSSFADFGTIKLDGNRGWVVTCHHDQILTLVGKNDVPPTAPEVEIGMIGRHMRGLDAVSLRVIHIEAPSTETGVQTRQIQNLFPWADSP